MPLTRSTGGSLLRETRLRLPGLSPLAEWCYGFHSRLMFQGSPLNSETGVQQGDPLGPLLFSYCSRPSKLLPVEALRNFDPRWWWPTWMMCAWLACRFGRRTPGRIASQPRQMRACGGAAATVDMSLFLPVIPLNQTGTFSLLGAPIGNGSFCNQFTTSERVAKALPLLDALALAGCPNCPLAPPPLCLPLSDGLFHQSHLS